jgi:hypothetical protein
MGVNNKKAVMKASKLKTVRNIGRIRTLLVALSVAVCLATLMGCGNASEKDASPAADGSPAADASPAADGSPAAEASPADDIETLRQAAEQGHFGGQYRLGLMYDKGEGVPEDDAEAVKWYRKAAEQGDAKAQNSLGAMYVIGGDVSTRPAPAAGSCSNPATAKSCPTYPWKTSLPTATRPQLSSPPGAKVKQNDDNAKGRQFSRMNNREDIMTKRERVERTLNLQPVDRPAVHDYIHSPHVHGLYPEVAAGDSVNPMHRTVRATLDMWRPMGPISSTDTTGEDGFESESTEEWTFWVSRRPFDDTAGLEAYILRDIDRIRAATDAFDAEKARDAHRGELLGHIQGVGDDTVMMGLDNAPLRDCIWRAGIELFSYLLCENPGAIRDWLDAYLCRQLQIVDALADRELAPVVLIANEIVSSAAPLLSSDMLDRFLFPDFQRITDAWHRRGVKVLAEVQGNSRDLIPRFIQSGADGFYAVEAIGGMDIVDLKNSYPQSIWACGVDGVELMTSGTAEQVEAEVLRQIEGTDALRTGGLFIGSSSEINPPIPPENFKAMVDAARSVRNPDFSAN